MRDGYLCFKRQQFQVLYSNVSLILFFLTHHPFPYVCVYLSSRSRDFHTIYIRMFACVFQSGGSLQSQIAKHSKKSTIESLLPT